MKYVIKPYEGMSEYKFGSSLEEILSKAENGFEKVDKGLLIKLYSDDLSLVSKITGWWKYLLSKKKKLNCITTITIYSATKI